MRFEVRTRLGPVWLHGEREPSTSGGPVIVCVAGAWPHPEPPLFRLGHFLPGFEVFAAHLPGIHSPPLVTSSVGGFGAAFSEVVASFGQRPVVVIGESVGALVTLAIRAPNLQRRVLLEPPLRTDGLWPLQREIDKGAQSPEFAEFTAHVFGVTPEGVEARNWRHLLDGLDTPTMAVCGDPPLGDPRPFTVMPSLVRLEDREALGGHPLVKLVVFQGAGHDLFPMFGSTLIDYLREFISPCAPADATRMRTSPR